MRLWHIDLIDDLPREQLLGQHRECAGLRGKGWDRPHATVNYVFIHPRSWLVRYHLRVIREMERRGYKPNPVWLNPDYRGKHLGFSPLDGDLGEAQDYPEHNAGYLLECIWNLMEKGVRFENELNSR